MEQRFRNRGVMNEDMINQLPEALVLRILSFLPTKTVIATSVLSKQWRSFWKLVPNFEFDSDDHKSEHLTFSESVSKSFLSYKASVLETLHLRVGLSKVIPVDIGVWVEIAFARHLRELVLDVIPERESFTFPSSLCTCNTLETLKLKFMIVVHIPSPVLLKSLTTLHLEFVTYKDDESIRNLLSGCPILENLVVYHSVYSDFLTFTIEVPSLKRLEIRDGSYGEEIRGYMINVPCLKFLEIEGLRGFDLCLNAPELVAACVFEGSYIMTEKFLISLKSTRHLSLDLSPLKITSPSGSIFYQLVSLEIGTRKPEWWNLLTFMLDSSPKLQVLRLVDEYLNFNKIYGLVGEKWNEPKYVPECLLSHLETFEWIRYSWEREEEKEVATYILRSARRLKKATFSTNPIGLEELNKLEKRRNLLNELNGVVRASNSCHLLFEVDSSCMY